MNEKIGHNRPPEMATTAEEVAKDLSGWLSEHPVVTEESVKEATIWLDRSRLCLGDLEDERKTKTGPLREQIKKIDDDYRGPRELLERVVGELKSRWSAFVAKIEAEKIAAAQAAHLEAERLEQAAREAERREQDAISSAAAGELGIDMAGVTAEADAAFADAKASQRAAQLAERETKVRFKGIFKARSLAHRTLEHLVDPWAVMQVTGITPGIALEVLKAARAYKRIHGKYPPGIEIEVERRI